MHDREESQDFYAGHYGDLLGFEDRPGDIVDLEGRALGRHSGLIHFTVGQRRGLDEGAVGLRAVPAADRHQKPAQEYQRGAGDEGLVHWGLLEVVLRATPTRRCAG